MSMVITAVTLRIFLTAVFSLFVIFPCFSVADEGKARLGRLPDGRAYRITEGGLRLVDQIAELEVTVNELQKQVRELEDETILQKQTIDELTGGKGVETKRSDSQAVRLPTNAPHSTLASAGVGSGASCMSVVAPLQQRIAELEAKIGEDRPIAAARCESVAAPLRAQIIELQNAVMSSPSKEEYSQRVEVAKVLEQNLRRRDEELATLSQRLAATRESLENTEAQLREKLAVEGKLKEEIALLSERLERTHAAPLVRGSLRPQKQEAQEVEASDLATVDSARIEFSRSLSRIQSLIMKRKDLYDALKSKARGVTIELQPLVTASGISLDSLRLSVSKLTPKTDLSRIRSGLSELEAKLQDDVNTLLRLTRS